MAIHRMRRRLRISSGWRARRISSCFPVFLIKIPPPVPAPTITIDTPPRVSPAVVFAAFLRLGLTSFGGPAAHIGYFHDEFVKRRRWLDEHAYADLVALTQFLPGPASSQLGFALGLQRAGWPGALAAWVGFTLPSAALMIAFAYGAARLGGLSQAGWVHGLKLAAVAVVAQAVWLMAGKLCRTRAQASLAALAAGAALALNAPWSQATVIGLAGAFGFLFLRRQETQAWTAPSPAPPMRRWPVMLVAVFALLLLGLPIASRLVDSHWVRGFDGFYRAGALVFGGGHVVLPLLQAEVVRPGGLTTDEFLAGYGAAQALPGPLFTFAAYLGTLLVPRNVGWLGGIWGLIAVFLPGLLLVGGALPFWERLRHATGLRAALHGANAAVVGVLFAALVHPVSTSALRGVADALVALAALALLQFARLPSWVAVLACAGAGQLLVR